MIYYVLVITGVFACSLSQLLLKKSANSVHKSCIYEVINPLVISAYTIFFCSLLINIWSMSKGVQLKEMAILESLGYVFVPILSVMSLGEEVGKREICGILLIIIGIIVFYQ